MVLGPVSARLEYIPRVPPRMLPLSWSSSPFTHSPEDLYADIIFWNVTSRQVLSRRKPFYLEFILTQLQLEKAAAALLQQNQQQEKKEEDEDEEKNEKTDCDDDAAVGQQGDGEEAEDNNDNNDDIDGSFQNTFAALSAPPPRVAVEKLTLLPRPEGALVSTGRQERTRHACVELNCFFAQKGPKEVGQHKVLSCVHVCEYIPGPEGV